MAMKTLFLSCLAAAKSADTRKWHGRSVYFVVTDRFAKSSAGEDSDPICDGREWCGGTFRGVLRQLDYIQGMGFDALWITPVVQQVEWRDHWNGTGYHGYWAKDFFAIDAHLGTHEDLLSLSAELHHRGMLFMLDIVVNHVGPIHSVRDMQHLGEGLNSASGEQFHQLGRRPGQSLDNYIKKPVTMGEAGEGCWPMYNFSDRCNYSIVLDGWFGDLADLRQENPGVSAYLVRWIRYMAETYSIDAFRLDTALYVPKWFLAKLQDAAGAPIIGEVQTYNMSLHRSFAPPLAGVLNFPIADQLSRIFSPDGLMSELHHLLDSQAALHYPDPHFLGNFIDNHDCDRFLFNHSGDLTQVRNGLILTLFYHGLPIVYYGTEQPPVSNASDERTSMWPDRYDTSSELYSYLARAHAVRRAFGFSSGGRHASSLAKTLGADDHHIVIRRGDLFVLVSNLGSGAGSSEVCVPGTLEPFEALVPVLGSGGASAADDQLCFHSSGGEPTVFARRSVVLV